MCEKYTLWLNGNSLVLVSRALAPRLVDDLLDVQLFAYRGASSEHSPFDHFLEWHDKSQEIQASLGCVRASFEASNMSDPPFTSLVPLDVLRAGVMRNVPAPWHGPLGASLDALKGLQQHAGLQALWERSVQPSVASGQDRVAMELRVVLPGPGIASCELWLESAQALGRQWLWQPLDGAVLHGVRMSSSKYLVQEHMLEAIRQLLRERLGGSTAAYRCLIGDSLPGARAHE